MNPIGEIKCSGYNFCPYITDNCRITGNFHGKKSLWKKIDAQARWSQCRYLGNAKVAMRSDWVGNRKESASIMDGTKKIKNIPCRYCDKKVSNLKALDQHVSAVHNELWSEYRKDQIVQARLSASNLSRCDKCGFFIKNMDEHTLTCRKTLKTNEVSIEDEKHPASSINSVKNLDDKELKIEKLNDKMEGKIMNFDELYTKRKNYVDVARENNFEEGLQNLLTELYPDNAHFIYELLQNAEDAGAGKILFELKKDQLLFYHDGSRVFDNADIDSITSIGNSTKKDDVNKIGKFGVGFKAVFAYTTKPQIHSGDVSFEIEDLFVPKQIESIEINEPYTTLISFPFNHPNKSKKKAYQEVKNHLDNLSDGTLMFLQNISSISWVVNNSQYSLERKENKNNRIEIVNTHNNTSTHWLCFTKKLLKHKKLFVGMAYKLQENEKDSSKFNIVPTKGEVSIFFPADKETSNLKFHIHAPFASTVARDSIKDLDENVVLIKFIAEMVSESLEFIKDEDLLNTDFFEVLPIPDDELSNLYIPIQKKIYDTFQKKKLLPTESGDFTNALSCYRSPIDIKRVFNREDLSIILEENFEDVYFVKSPRQLNSRADKFVQSLNMKLWGWDELAETIDTLNYELLDSTLEDYKKEDEYEIYLHKREWLESKTNEWVQSFYALLWDAYDKHNTYIDYPTLIKLGHSFNYAEEEVYFPSDDNTLTDFLYVNSFTYTSGSNKRQQEKGKSFLEKNGVKEITEKEKLKLILDEHYAADEINVDHEVNLQHLKSFVDYYKDGNDISFMGEYNFLLCNRDGKQYWGTPDVLLLDEPYKKTGLEVIIDIEEKYLIDEIYLQLEDKESFLEILIKLGVQDRLEISETTTSLNPESDRLREGTWNARYTSKSEDKDYKIYKLDEIFNLQDSQASLQIWNTMNDASSTVLIAKYTPNGQFQVRIADSILVHSLRTNAWIPGQDGEFYKPQDIASGQLLDTFKIKNKNGWLDAIEFGKNIEKQKEEYKEKEEFIKDLGFDSLDELALLRQLKEQYSEDELKNMLTQSVEEDTEQQSLRDALSSDESNGDSESFVRPKDDDTTILDDNKHKENIHQDNAGNKNSFDSTKVNLKKQNLEEIQKINTFLYAEYEGHCQVCGDTFAAGGKNFFKHKSLNSGKDRDVNRKGNTVCLCPKHWEIFTKKLVAYSFSEQIQDMDNINIETMKEEFEIHSWVSKDDINTKNDAFYMLDEEDDFLRDNLYFLPIKMFSKTEYLKFTKAHMMEFVEVWNNN